MQYIRPVFTDEEVRRAEARAQKEAREREVAEKKAAEIAAAEAAVEAARLAAYRAEVALEERERAEAAARKRKEAEDRARRKPDKVKAKLAMREIIPKIDRAWSRTYSHDTAAVQRFTSSVYPKPKAHARPPLVRPSASAAWMTVAAAGRARLAETADAETGPPPPPPPRDGPRPPCARTARHFDMCALSSELGSCMPHAGQSTIIVSCLSAHFSTWKAIECLKSARPQCGQGRLGGGIVHATRPTRPRLVQRQGDQGRLQVLLREAPYL